MIILTNPADLARLLGTPIDAGLRRLLALRRDEIEDEDAARFAIVQPGDAAAEIEAALGFPIVTNLVDGARPATLTSSPTTSGPNATPAAGWSSSSSSPSSPRCCSCPTCPASIGRCWSSAAGTPDPSPTPSLAASRHPASGAFLMPQKDYHHAAPVRPRHDGARADARPGPKAAPVAGRPDRRPCHRRRRPHGLDRVLVVQPGDTEDDIVRAIGLSPLVEPIHGARFGEPGFHPHWDWLSDHGGWFEMIFTFGSTFAYVLFVIDEEETSVELLGLCRKFSTDRNQRPDQDFRV